MSADELPLVCDGCGIALQQDDNVGWYSAADGSDSSCIEPGLGHTFAGRRWRTPGEDVLLTELPTEPCAILGSVRHAGDDRIIELALVGPDLDGLWHSAQDGPIDPREIMRWRPQFIGRHSGERVNPEAFIRG